MAAVSDHQLHYSAGILSTSVGPGLPYFFFSALIVSVVLPIYRFVSRDYRNFLSLGPGGTPSNFAGYLKVSGLRLFTLKDPFIPEVPSSNVQPINGYLVRLPFRPGARPAVAGIAPQRQINQKPTPELCQSFKNAVLSLAEAYPSELRKGISCFEKNGLALFLSQSPAQSCETTDLNSKLEPIMHTNDAIETPGHLNPTCGDSAEICHVHAMVSQVVVWPFPPVRYLPGPCKLVLHAVFFAIFCQLKSGYLKLDQRSCSLLYLTTVMFSIMGASSFLNLYHTTPSTTCSGFELMTPFFRTHQCI